MDSQRAVYLSDGESEDSDEHIYDSVLIRRADGATSNMQIQLGIQRKIYFLTNTRKILCELCKRMIFSTNHRCVVAIGGWLGKKTTEPFNRRLFYEFLKHNALLYRMCSRQEFSFSSASCLSHLPTGKQFKIVANTLYQQVQIPDCFGYEDFAQTHSIIPATINKTTCRHKTKIHNV